jgi:hypothetical protein
MQFLVVNSLRWAVTLCTMWGLTCCRFMQSSVVRYPQADHPAVAVRRAHQAPLDRRAQVARQVLRVQVAPRDRAEAVDHLDQENLDPAEAPDPPAQAGAQGPADTLDPVVHQVAVDHLVRAAHRVARDRVVARDHQVPRVQADPPAALDHRDHQDRRARQDPVEHRANQVALDHRDPADQVPNLRVHLGVPVQAVRQVHRVARAQAAPRAHPDRAALEARVQVGHLELPDHRVQAEALDPVARADPVDQAVPPDHPDRNLLALAVRVLSPDPKAAVSHQVLAPRVKALVYPDRFLVPAQASNHLESPVVELAPAVLVQADRAQAVPVAREVPVNHRDPVGWDQAVRARAAIAAVLVTTSGTVLAGIL